MSRCRSCEEPIDVLDLCDECEMNTNVIEPVEVMTCSRGHLMTKGAGKTHNGWLCEVCRRMSQAAYRSKVRERRLWNKVHS